MGAGSWAAQSGSWSTSGGVYRQTGTTAEATSLRNQSSSYGNVSLSARVRLDGPSQDTLAGLVARRQGTAVGAYLVAVRGKNSGAQCGI